MALIQTLMNSKKHVDEVDLDISVADNVAVRPRLEKMRCVWQVILGER